MSHRGCVILGQEHLERLLWRYNGVGAELSNDERELLLFALYNESEARGGIAAAASKSLAVHVAANCEHVIVPESACWGDDEC